MKINIRLTSGKAERQVRTVDKKEHLDKLIGSMCGYIQKAVESDEKFIRGEYIAKNIKALAELVSARALMSRD